MVTQIIVGTRVKHSSDTMSEVVQHHPQLYPRPAQRLINFEPHLGIFYPLLDRSWWYIVVKVDLGMMWYGYMGPCMIMCHV